MRKILESCPSCHGPLAITEVRCQSCHTEVRSQYQPCDFCTLTEEQSTFVRLFVQNRGKLNAMEDLLGISYPTVSAKLDEIIARLQGHAAQRGGSAPSAPPPPLRPAPAPTPVAAGRASAPVGSTRRDVLDRLSSGALSAAEALVLLQGGGASAPPDDRRDDQEEGK